MGPLELGQSHHHPHLVPTLELIPSPPRRAHPGALCGLSTITHGERQKPQLREHPERSRPRPEPTARLEPHSRWSQVAGKFYSSPAAGKVTASSSPFYFWPVPFRRQTGSAPVLWTPDTPSRCGRVPGAWSRGPWERYGQDAPCLPTPPGLCRDQRKRCRAGEPCAVGFTGNNGNLRVLQESPGSGAGGGDTQTFSLLNLACVFDAFPIIPFEILHHKFTIGTKKLGTVVPTLGSCLLNYA
ncbi:uncharacterized protein LOC119707095 [Motacilla alba alba]|uniref:uncharacterized protein LOC119707095 n=1 Tax=Motacilla alba alba TaxID=1094192 RepID=UPI0018D4F1CA|nr:uncharacterized protein LOC119707095 [Motacilla alba alba]